MEFLHLAFSVALSALILIEYIRYFRLQPLGPQLHKFLITFTNERDSGVAILSHIYLLAGCALPVWIVSLLDKEFHWIAYSGVIALGFGDSLVSLLSRCFII
jgi:dolichol kinase